jgi:hypothetical protein
MDEETALKQADAAAADPAPPLLPPTCIRNCKYGGEEKNGRKTLTMIRCCMCMKWFDVECIGGEKQTSGVVWHCDFCRTLPNQLHQVLDLVLCLNGNQTTMQKSLDTLTSECGLLRTENAHLRAQIEKIQVVALRR